MKHVGKSWARQFPIKILTGLGSGSALSLGGLRAALTLGIPGSCLSRAIPDWGVAPKLPRALRTARGCEYRTAPARS